MPEPLFSPTLLALMAAVLFGVTVVFAKLGLREVDTFAAARFSIGVTLAFFIVLALLTLHLRDFHTPWLLLFVLIGFFQPFFSMFLSFEANHRLGPTVSATVSSTSPLFAMTGAVLWLGESLTAPIFLGTLGVVVGVMVLSWQGRGRKEIQVLALVLAIATAMIRGFGNLGQKYGMGMVPLPVMAGLITYTVSFTLGMAVHVLSPRRRPLRIPWAAARWLALAGIGNGFAIWCMISALKSGVVVVVVPIVGSFPLFTLLASLLWFRQERITLRVVAGMLLILPSVAVISLYR